MLLEEREVVEYIPNNARIFTCRGISIEIFGLIEPSPNMVLKLWNSENVKKTKQREIVEQCAWYKVHSLVTYAKLSPNAFLQGHQLPPDVPLCP
jgi:hypothetical protein